jgi:hypothetical protein
MSSAQSQMMGLYFESGQTNLQSGFDLLKSTNYPPLKIYNGYRLLLDLNGDNLPSKF